MRICLHTNWEIDHKYIGGTERFLINISKELYALGMDPFIVCSSKTEESNIEGIKVIGRFFENSNYKNDYPYFSSRYIKEKIIGEHYSLESLKRLSEYTERQLKDINADVFHLNSFISASFLNPNDNYVITNHENNLEYNWYWGENFFDFFKNEVRGRRTNLHKFKFLFAPSFYYAEYFSKQFDLKVTPINLGVSLNEFPFQKKENTLSVEQAFNRNDILILLPSRFQPFQKGHDIALKACKILKEKKISFKIIFTGVKKSSEKYRSDFDNLVIKYDLQKNVKVITFTDISEAYRNIDIVISPERYCSYGLSITESLSLGIPTILSDIPTYKEIAEGFEHAFFFKNESAYDLAEKIISVINNYNMRNKIEGIKFRIKNDLRECAKKYSDIYFRILQNQSKYNFSRLKKK